MKRKFLAAPFLIMIIFLLVGVGVAGAAIYFGTSSGGETNTEGINLQKGLVGHWKFDGNAKDSTANSKHGTLNGDAAVTATDRKGQVNKAATFDGTGDYVNVGNVLTGSGAFSVSAWFKPDNLGDWRSIAGAGCTPGFDITVNDNDMYYGRNCGGGNFYTISDKVSAGQWYNIVVVFDGTNANAYLNNVKYTGGAETYDNTGTTVYIGSYNGSGEFFNGLIDDVRIYNRALSATEVTALYQEYDPGIVISDLQKGLVGNWKMDGNAKDSTANSNHGTVTGATLTTDRKGQVNKAYSFDGDEDYVDAGNGASLNPGTGDFTYGFWAKSSQSSWVNIFGKANGDYSSLSAGWIITIRSDLGDNLLYYTHTHFDNKVSWAVGQFFEDGIWHHWVFVGNRVAGTVELFKDGVSQGTQSPGGSFATANITTTSNLTIGCSTNCAYYGRDYSGLIDDVRIYNRVLSQAEITALYESY